MTKTRQVKKRIKWIDLARALAIVMVLVCHTTEKAYTLNIESMPLLASGDQTIAFALLTVGRMGVPFFLFMTGFLLLDRDYDKQGCIDFYRRRWLPLFIITEVWIVLLALWHFAMTGQLLTLPQFAKRMLFLVPLQNAHFWYLPMILGVYLFVPIIGAGLKRIQSPRAIALPLVLLAVFALGYPTTSIIVTAAGGKAFETYINIGYSGMTYLLYVLLGWAMKRGAFSRVPAVLAALVGVAAFAACVWMQQWSYSQGLQYNLFYNNVFLMICSVCAFTLLSRIKNPHPYPFWRGLAYYSFAIYLIHNPVMQLLTPYMTARPLTQPAQVGVYVLVLLAASWAVAAVIALVPFVGKRLLYLK